MIISLRVIDPLALGLPGVGCRTSVKPAVRSGSAYGIGLHVCPANFLTQDTGLGGGRRSGTLTLSEVTEVPPPVAEDRSAEADEFVTCAGSSPA